MLICQGSLSLLKVPQPVVFLTLEMELFVSAAWTGLQTYPKEVARNRFESYWLNSSPCP